MHRASALVVLIALAIAQAGCQGTTHAAPATAPVHGYVTDVKAFDAFIATRPTPEQFHAAYPDVQLVLPGTITTMEFRTNNSRYYAELGKDGRISGGRFG